MFAHARHRDQRVAGAPRNASIRDRRADILAHPEQRAHVPPRQHRAVRRPPGGDTHEQPVDRMGAVVLSAPPAGKDDCCNMRNNCCRT
uniref:Uncharacterized protein n=1 Tax=Burkholderia orbicola (strain AU 1054) TaxID=331271 RepID=A0A0H2XUP5_BURO1